MLVIKGSCIKSVKREVKPKNGQPFEVFDSYFMDERSNSRPQQVQTRKDYTGEQNIEVPVYINVYARRDGSPAYGFREVKQD